jgi:signal transduction histidine kinase/CheY-like chemotaxis protein/HPt (histidine-containing phosphotransfer) domain-containing protein
MPQREGVRRVTQLIAATGKLVQLGSDTVGSAGGTDRFSSQLLILLAGDHARLTEALSASRAIAVGGVGGTAESFSEESLRLLRSAAFQIEAAGSAVYATADRIAQENSDFKSKAVGLQEQMRRIQRENEQFVASSIANGISRAATENAVVAGIAQNRVHDEFRTLVETTLETTLKHRVFESGIVSLILVTVLVGVLYMIMRVYSCMVIDITGPLDCLLGATSELTTGRAPQLSLGGNDEIGQLAAALKQMVDAKNADREQLLSANEELRRANEQLEGANEKVQQFALRAGEANIAKRDFLAVMSHEIRTPVNGIIGMCELALQTDLTVQQREYMETVNSCAISLLDLLNDVLDFSKIEAGKLELELTEFGIRELLGETMRTVAVRAQTKGLELLLHIRPEVPDILIGDPHRLRQVVLNLVGNAIKFTERGEILLRVENDAWVEGHAVLRFSVIDTGVGIPEDRLLQIFSAFTQADYSTTRKFGGTGLGLAITSQLVELMGGKINVESRLQQGSTFKFTCKLGYKRHTDSAEDDATIGILEHKRVVICDSHSISLKITEELMRVWKMDVVATTTHDDTVRAVRCGIDAGRVPHLVVLDISKGPGIEAIEEIRNLAPESGLRFLVIASAIRKEEALQCERAGADAVITKPITFGALRNAAVKALEPRTGRGAGFMMPKLGDLPSQRPQRILLAEDNLVNQRLAVLHLEQWGHTVTVANDGVEAVEAFEKQQFDLIVMDLQMPRMSGFEAAMAIREREARTGGRTPILALSANVLKGVKDECAAAGMDGYVSKPVRQKELLSAITQTLPNLVLSPEAIAPQQRVLSPNEPPAPEPAPIHAERFDSPRLSNLPQSQHFDRESLLQSVGGSLEILAEVVSLGRDDDAPRLLKMIDDGIQSGSNETVSKAAHGLKGLAGSLYAHRVFQTATFLEAQAVTGIMEAVVPVAEQIQQELKELFEALELMLTSPQG